MAEHPSTEVVLCGGKRTPFGDFGKSLRDVVGTDLGIHAATATLDGVGLDAGHVETYGQPARGQHAVQVEIDRALYMDEKRIEPNANFEALKTILRDVAAEIVEIGEPEIPLAAE